MFVAAFLTISGFFLLWLFYWYYRRQYFEKYLYKIPGPAPLPLLGSALELNSATSKYKKIFIVNIYWIYF